MHTPYWPLQSDNKQTRMLANLDEFAVYALSKHDLLSCRRWTAQDAQDTTARRRLLVCLLPSFVMQDAKDIVRRGAVCRAAAEPAVHKACSGHVICGGTALHKVDHAFWILEAAVRVQGAQDAVDAR